MDVRHVREKMYVPLRKTRDLGNMLLRPTVDESWYHRFVGQVTHLATIRPDTAFATLQLAKGLQQQTKEHHAAARDLLIYLRDTKDLGCEYGVDPSGAQLTDTSTDSSFGGDRVTGHADGGHVTTLKQGLVAAKASTQSAVTTNSFEAENMQLCSTTKGVLKLRNYMEHDFDMPLNGPSLVRIDNEAVRAFAQNVAPTRMARHINQAQLFGREQFRNGLIDLVTCKSEDNVADIHTKVLSRRVHEKHCRAMGMRRRSEIMEQHQRSAAG